MMRRLLMWVCVGVSLVATHAFGLTWDFENPDQFKVWKSVNGDWSIKEGAMVDKDNRQPAQRILVGEASWTDYTIEAKLRVDDGNWAGIVFRAKSDFEYYVAYLNVPDNKSELWRHNPGAHDARNAINSNFAAKDTKVERGKWMDVKIEIAGDLFKYTLNGKPQWEATDGNYKAGKVGVWTWQTSASFDDFSVNGKGIPVGLAVAPQGKAASVWGVLKSR